MTEQEQATPNAARPLASHSLLTPDDCARYKRGLARRLEIWGLTPTTCGGGSVMGHTFEKDADKWDAWLHDTLHRAIVDYETGEYKYALRGLFQARVELGRCGGFYPGGFAHDVVVALQNAIESILFQDEKGLASQVREATAIKVRDQRERVRLGYA